jgi:hypothetical protein
MTMSKEWRDREKLQKCLYMYERASTPLEAEAAEAAARRLVHECNVDPTLVPDEYAHVNLGRNVLLQRLREEWIAKHPPKADALSWRIDEAHSIPEAVAYRAGDYLVYPFMMKGFAGSGDYVSYSVTFEGKPLRNGSGVPSYTAKDVAERHNSPKNRKARARAAAANEASMAYWRDHPLGLGE